MSAHPADLALDRLAAHRAGKRRGPVFSSDLSVDEAVLLKEVGYEARGLVMGSAIFHVGYTFGTLGRNTEIVQLSEAMVQAREAALGRLRQDAARRGADGVVGVRLEIGMFERARSILEFVAIGTAVGAGERALERSWKGAPFTSDLSGQDFHLLQRAGWEPLGLVMGSCVYHVARQGLGRWASRAAVNGEIESYTEALYDARELAMGRLQEEALRLRAHGVVGVTVAERSHVWGSRAIEFFALGTAVRLVHPQHRFLSPRPVVPLADAAALVDPGAITGARHA